jgi:hypothetical protein
MVLCGIVAQPLLTLSIEPQHALQRGPQHHRNVPEAWLPQIDDACPIAVVAVLKFLAFLKSQKVARNILGQ